MMMPSLLMSSVVKHNLMVFLQHIETTGKCQKKTAKLASLIQTFKPSEGLSLWQQTTISLQVQNKESTTTLV
jgi:hypothetical protein